MFSLGSIGVLPETALISGGVLFMLDTAVLLESNRWGP
jgi:hypothetical protein